MVRIKLGGLQERLGPCGVGRQYVGIASLQPCGSFFLLLFLVPSSTPAYSSRAVLNHYQGIHGKGKELHEEETPMTIPM